MRIIYFFIFLLAAASAFAQGTQSWEQSKFEDFEKGDSKGVAILSEGGLELAPQFKALYTSPSTYLWAITADKNGNVYAAAGAPARVYRITPAGKSEIIFEPKELQVQAIAERDGVIYAATSPDGKIYKLTPQKAALAKSDRGEAASRDAASRDAASRDAASRDAASRDAASRDAASRDAASRDAASRDAASREVTRDVASYVSTVFFDPQTKYIWDLAIDPAGQMYVATGDQGEIFRVSPKGKGSVFFKSDEAHIRVLAFDHKGNLIAGSDGSGLIYRISPAGEAFVLYSAPKKEITALAVDVNDDIYAAGIGEKRALAPPSSSPQFSTAPPRAASGATPIAGASDSSAPVLSFPPSALSGAAGGSEIYKITADGSPTRLWSSRDDLVYALGFARISGKERLVAGTGNKGRIFTIRENDKYTDLLKASANQVTAFASAPNGTLYAATSNLGKIFWLGAMLEPAGSYESDVFDARLFSHWGRAEARGRGKFDLLARSGNVDNPDRNWSPWQKMNLSSAVNAAMEAPPARFVQWKAVLHAGEPEPHLDSVLLNYLTKNVAPVIEDVTVQVGARFPPPVKISNEPMTTVVSGASTAQANSQREAGAPTAFRDKNSIAVRWSAHDDNDDDLVYSLFYHGDGESGWKPLTKERIQENYYSFDANLLPDGGYAIKVVASDAPSHPADEALTAEKESSRFEVDTTPPRIEDLNAAFDSDGQIHVTFRVLDSFSDVSHAEYSLDANDWQLIEPIGKLSDAKTENYDFTIPISPAQRDGEHTLVVRAYDRFDNLGSAKAILGAKK